MFKKFLTWKAKGNITSLIFGQMFLLLLTVWCLFNFRLIMLNTSFNYIDDALTSSILGGALVNVEEYGLSNQLIIYESDKLKDIDGEGLIRGWEQWEADILLSEYNDGAEFGMFYGYDVLEWKKEVDISHRNTVQQAYIDDYLRQSVSAFSGNFTFNITNGKHSNIIDVENNINTISKTNTLNKALIVPTEELNDTFLKNYIVSDLVVSKLEIYNVYKRTFAQKHYYKSEYIEWNGNTPIWVGPKTEDEFNDYFQDIIDTVEENGFEGIEIAEYKAHKYSTWLKDLDAFNTRASQGKLILFTDTGVSYQGVFNDDNTEFDYLYVDSLHADPVSNGDKAGATGYSVYSYNNTGNMYSTTYKYNEIDNDKIIINEGNMSGVELDNTSLYIELTFKVKTFPGALGASAPEKEVTISRLIDIEIAE